MKHRVDPAVPSALQQPASPEHIAAWLLKSLRPDHMVDAGDARSALFTALRSETAVSALPLVRVENPDELGNQPANALILLSPDRISDGWQLMDWIRRLAPRGAVVLEGPPPRDSVVAGQALDDGLHWLFTSGADLLVGAGFTPGSVQDETAILTLEDAQLLLTEQRHKLAELQASLGAQHSELDNATQALAKAERKVASLRRALEASGLATQSTFDNLRAAHGQIGSMLHSRSWRLTAPLRGVHLVLRKVWGILRNLFILAKATLRVSKQNGLREAGRRISNQLRQPSTLLRAGGGGSWKLNPEYPLPAAIPGSTSQRTRVLLVAEMGIAQCLKYRVLQKQQMIEGLGYDCTIVNWVDNVCTRDLLATHNVAVFYRVPGYPDQMETIALARSMGVRTFWEVDDLIFDLEHYLNNSNINDLPPAVRKGILEGVPLYRKAMLACDGCIASTTAMADAMRTAGAEDTWVVENALDIETLRAAEEIASAPPRGDGLLRIVYGSGSKAHDSDFRVAAPAILRILRKRYDVRLTIIGHLNLPPEFKELDAQIERLPPSDYSTYMRRLAKCQINIAPLERTTFNDTKSNIKYLEAGILSIPSVCTPTVEYQETIEHGVTGMLAGSEAEWEMCLMALVESPGLRRQIGEAARLHVEEDYIPQAVAVHRLEPWLQSLAVAPRPRPRILGVNIFFEPRSFGGATIVAEQMERIINADGRAEYATFTTLPTTDVHAYKVVRYQSSAGEVFAMGLPHENDPALQFDNPYPTGCFREVLRAWRPDVVHIHSIQGIGIQIAEVCQAEGVPFVVTLHDAWWICARQFMVNDKGQYCYQRKVDLDVCKTCVPHPAMNPYRQHRLHEVLTGAALLLSPSQFFAGIYADNGFDPSRLRVNKNGIAKPKVMPNRSAPSTRKIRFGFVGGEGPIKGSPLIKKALQGLSHTNYELHVVDNELNLGRRSIFESNWKVPGVFKAVPAYTQQTIDDFFGSIDVLLFPTQWKESFGLSVREALIRDVWVIATDAGGVIEDIVDGQNGNIIPLDDDGTALQAVIRNLLEAPDKLDGYRNPHADMVRLFDEQADELTDYLLEVVERQPVNWRLPTQIA
ncbi:glycosyltransferase [Xanthomonas sp. WHRI 7065]|uniref:glycosyltransferase n=1 Tax=Xanthomonas sp. WHRI 7065 TaxID=3161569 RepID=UPI0032E8ECDF